MGSVLKKVGDLMTPIGLEMELSFILTEKIFHSFIFQKY